MGSKLKEYTGARQDLIFLFTGSSGFRFFQIRSKIDFSNYFFFVCPSCQYEAQVKRVLVFKRCSVMV